MKGNKEITIWDIAQKLNISIATVSRALKDDPVVQKKTKKKIIETAEQMGYRTNSFASNLRSNNSNTIGIIVPRLHSFFMSSVISGVESIANAEGYNLIISQSAESVVHEKQNVLTMYNNRVAGLLVSLSSETDNIEHFDPFLKKDIPLIFFDRVIEHQKIINIIIDNKRAAFDITEHLISQGCKRIIHITTSLKNNVYNERLQGYRQALEKYKIAYDESLIKLSDLSMEAGEKLAGEILKMKKLPDAIFASNDSCAAGCLLALKKAGIRIPETIAFAGFNNDPFSRVVEPNLTTVNYAGFDMGVVSAQTLINQIKSENTLTTTNSIILRSELIIRDSSLKKQAGRR
jgi:LacI family transcriptional regulator